MVSGNVEGNQKSWVSSLAITRYCPQCLESDSVPYLRVLWRLHLSPICPKHSMLLYNRCWKCGRRQSIIRFHSEKQSSICRSCGSKLSQAPAITPRNCDTLFSFSSSIREILDGELPKEFEWPHSAAEFFDVLRFTLRFLNLWQQRTQSWEKQLKAYGLPVFPPFDWRQNEAVACLLLERSLELLENWPKNMKIFVISEQTRFNILCREYGKSLPMSLSQFMSRPTGKVRGVIASRCEFPSAEFDKFAVRTAVKLLAQSDWAITETTLSRLTRIHNDDLASTTLGSIIREEKRREEGNQKARVKDAIAALTKRRIRPTIRSVATYLGRPEWVIQKNPELLEMVKFTLGQARSL